MCQRFVINISENVTKSGGKRRTLLVKLGLMLTWGVVTSTAPSTLCFLRFSRTAKCSSDVPGGVSTSSTSSSPHATSDTNWPIRAVWEEDQRWGTQEQRFVLSDPIHMVSYFSYALISLFINKCFFHSNKVTHILQVNWQIIRHKQCVKLIV